MADGVNEWSAPSRGSVADKPAAWAVICGDCMDSTFTDRDEAVEWACGLIPPPQIVPLYRSPTLTDAERDAIAYFAVIDGPQYLPQATEAAATLRGLLDRMSPPAT